MNREFSFRRTPPAIPITYDAEKCIGCLRCMEVCQIDVMLPPEEPGQPPIVAYPDECWYCACCVEACPRGALEMHLPVNQRILFKRKETGEVFRIGALDSPEKSYFKPPVGW